MGAKIELQAGTLNRDLMSINIKGKKNITAGRDLFYNNYTWLALVFLVITLFIILYCSWSPLTTYAKSLKKFDCSDTTKLRVLLLSFKPDINLGGEMAVEDQLMERLLIKQEQEDISIDILQLVVRDDWPYTESAAIRIGKNKCADLVVWGNYEEGGERLNSVRIRHTLTTDFNIDPTKRYGDTEMQPLETLRDLRQGYWQEDIDYIIYWVEAVSGYKENNYKRAHYYIEKINHPASREMYSPETCSILGEIYRSIGQYQIALQFQQQAINIQEEANPTHPHMAIYYGHIGLTYNSLDEHQEGLGFLQKAIDLQKNILSPNHLHLATSYNNIGLTYHDLNQYEQALECYKKSLNIREERLDSLHPALANSYHNISLTLYQLEQYEEALNYQVKAIDIQEKLSTEDPELAIFYTSIASTLSRLSQHPKALEFQRKAIGVQEKFLPPNHPQLINSYNSAGVLYFQLGQHEKSISFLQKAINIKEKNLEPNHIDLARSYYNMGYVLNALENYDSALFFFQKAIKIHEEKRLKNAELGFCYLHIATTYKKMEAFENAINFQQKSLAFFKNSPPEFSHHQERARNALSEICIACARYYAEQNQKVQAISCMQRGSDLDYNIIDSLKTNGTFISNQVDERSRELLIDLVDQNHQ